MALREIVLDTETTGIDPASGDRIVEIGALELLNHIPTGRTYHQYINPQRPMSAGAFAVHGLSDEFLADKPAFATIADAFHAFLGDARLVIHNAAFDVGFINAEFVRTGHPKLGPERALDTLHLARRKHPGASNSLDALCSRYGIDNTRRTKHGALLDTELLAEVYIELIGGKQTNLGLSHAAREPATVVSVTSGGAAREPRHFQPRLTEGERAAHVAFVTSLGAGSVWAGYGESE